MARGVSNFKQQDVTRALRGARKAGLDLCRAEIGADGKIVIVFDRSEPDQKDDPPSALDQWRASRGAN